MLLLIVIELAYLGSYQMFGRSAALLFVGVNIPISDELDTAVYASLFQDCYEFRRRFYKTLCFCSVNQLNMVSAGQSSLFVYTVWKLGPSIPMLMRSGFASQTDSIKACFKLSKHSKSSFFTLVQARPTFTISIVNSLLWPNDSNSVGTRPVLSQMNKCFPRN